MDQEHTRETIINFLLQIIDEYFSRVYHDEFLACYAQRAEKPFSARRMQTAVHVHVNGFALTLA